MAGNRTIIHEVYNWKMSFGASFEIKSMPFLLLFTLWILITLSWHSTHSRIHERPHICYYPSKRWSLHPYHPYITSTSWNMFCKRERTLLCKMYDGLFNLNRAFIYKKYLLDNLKLIFHKVSKVLKWQFKIVFETTYLFEGRIRRLTDILSRKLHVFWSGRG
jgi:hypothetical protein